MLPACHWKKSPWHGLSWERRIEEISRNFPNIYSNPNAKRRETEKWYFQHNGKLEGSGYFVGYDFKSFLCIGYIGRNGFRHDEPPEDEQFPVDGRQMENNSSVLAEYIGYSNSSPEEIKPGDKSFPPNVVNYLLSREGLYKINSNRRTSELVWKDADLGSLVIVSEPIPLKPSNHYYGQKSYLAIRKPDRVVLLDETGKEARSYVLPEEIREQDFQWYELGGGKAMIVASSGRFGGNYSFYWLEEGGKKVRHQEIALDQSRNSSQLDWGMGFWMPSPLGLAVASHLGEEDNAEANSSIWKSIQEAWPSLIVLGVACVGLAWLSFRRQRKFGLPWTGAWTVFVLMMGVPGYLGYLAHRRWPAILPCPHCGKPAPRDRAACLHCGREFPAPAPHGNRSLYAKIAAR